MSETVKKQKKFNIWMAVFGANYLFYAGYFKLGFIYSSVPIFLELLSQMIIGKAIPPISLIVYSIGLASQWPKLKEKFESQGGTPNLGKGKNISVLLLAVLAQLTLYGFVEGFVPAFKKSFNNKVKNESQQSNPEQFLAGLDLTIRKDEVLEKYHAGFKRCDTKEKMVSCYWDLGHQPFDAISFKDNHILFVNFRSDEEISVTSEIKSVQQKMNKQYNIEPVRTGMSAKEAKEMMEHTSETTYVDIEKMQDEEYLAMACEVSFPYFNGRLRFIAHQKNYLFKDCTSEVMNHLTVKGFQYVSKEYDEIEKSKK